MSQSMLEERALSFEPYWWETQKKQTSLNSSLPENVDVLIVGAGYTGLAAAIVASDLGAKTVVVEAEEAGKGASTRNGGMFGAHPRLSWQTLSEKFGVETADQIFEEASASLTFVKRLISDELIDCDLIQSGRIQLAWSKKDHENQKQLASNIKQKSNVSVQIISREELSGEIKTDRYFGGILFEEHGGINPAKFHNGLMTSLIKRKVSVLENMPVLSIERMPRGFKVHFLNKELFVKNVIMATNGYTTNKFYWFKKRVFPVPSFLIATENLPKELIRELTPRGRMMVETRAQYNYFRPSPNGKKIIFGGRAALKPIPLKIAAERLKASLDDIWPELINYQLTNVWTGYTGFSFNHIPHIGSYNGINYAMGYSGSGTVLAAYLGAKVAYKTLGDRRGETGYSQTKLKTNLFHIFEKPYFLSVADLWYRNVIDRLQRR
ncbi:MAG: FAD-binding oxidoreductase [Paracoccaceae bacterium]|nr:FAD-binding oxidoreductase [Paracoccaceae bacterium]